MKGALCMGKGKPVYTVSKDGFGQLARVLFDGWWEKEGQKAFDAWMKKNMKKYVKCG